MENVPRSADRKELAFVFACSHGSDVGEIACRASRKIGAARYATAHCIPGSGLSVDGGYVKNARSADRVLVIDGCDSDCTKKTLELAGVSIHAHLRVSDLGLVKDSAAVNDENIERVVEAAQPMLFNPLKNKEDVES
jgi:uncharacterized metal-binding protein